MSAASIDLAWTVPHDDTGIAGYDIRISNEYITQGNWERAIQLAGGGGDHKEGETEVKTLSNMPPEKTLFIGVKSYDAGGNMSDISNILQAQTKEREKNTPSVIQPIATDTTNAASQQPLTPHNQGTARMVIKTPSGGVPEDLIFINFINTESGLSFGGSAIDGLLATELPKGKYKIRMLLAPQYAEPRSLAKFEITDGASVDLGVITLEPGTAANFAQTAEAKGGIAKILGFIVQLLFEILKQLKAIVAKVGA